MGTQHPRHPLERSGPFRWDEGLAAGLSRTVLCGPRFRRLFPTVYVGTGVRLSPRQWAEAGLLILPTGAFASHATAARLYGLPIPTLPEEHFSVLRAEDRRRPDGMRCHVCPAPDVRLVDGVRVSGPEQLFVELASLLTLVDLVVVGDRLVRVGLTTPERLRRLCAATRLPRRGDATRAAGFVREDVDSPMETRLRMLLVLSGLPEPRVNLKIRDVDGTPLRRYDLSWPQVRAIVEYDGRHHVERIEQWESDIERREAIDDDGWRIIVVVSSGIYKNPGRTIERVWRLLRRRGLPGLPAQPSDAWQAHFRGR